MKLSTRLAAGILALGCMAGVSVTVAAPAQAATSQKIMFFMPKQKECNDRLMASKRVDQRMGFRISNFKSCTGFTGHYYGYYTRTWNPAS